MKSDSLLMSVIIFSVSSTGILGYLLIYRIYKNDFSKYLFRFMRLYIISCAKVLTDDYVLVRSRDFINMSQWEIGFRIVLGALIFFNAYMMLSQLNLKYRLLMTIFTIGAFVIGLSSFLISFTHILPAGDTILINRICSVLMSLYIAYTGMIMRNGIHKDWHLSFQDFVRKISSMAIVYIPLVWLIIFLQLLTGITMFRMVLIDMVLITIFSIFSYVSVSEYIRRQTSRKEFAVSTDFVSDYGISQREHEVLELIMKGLSNKDIGEKLYISLSTTRTHISHIFEKTSVKSRMELLYKVLSH